MNHDIDTIVSKLTLEEKASLCSGRDMWTTKPIERLGVPSVMVTDGPHGLRKQKASSDHVGLLESIPATCFPSGSALASSWDRALMRRVGVALGEEAATENVAILLGPGVNIKRTPLCGRNFEYYSEDPFLSTEMAASYIDGVQSRGVGTSVKHFVANNQEYRRVCIDTLVDERTLREIYLASFEGAVRKAAPWSIMSAYNKLDGTYCSDNVYLLTRILREEWKYGGFVVSDWGAENDRVEGIKAGLDLEMPGTNGRNDAKIVEAVRRGELDEAALDTAVRRILVFLKKAEQRPDITRYDLEEHDRLAREVAGECTILLKNDEEVLPLASHQAVAVVGELAKAPRYQGGGSSHINPTYLHNTWEEMRPHGAVTYARGYDLASELPDESLEREAITAAKRSDVVVVCAGLPASYESEGYDRKHLRLPANQNRLIEALAATDTPVVVVLSNGSAVEMPWVARVEAVVEGYLGGQAGGGAIADVLYGRTNPSGKLAETFPKRLEDTPASLFGSEGNTVTYREGVFVGYRYYDAKKCTPLFPFGHGLSYTTFAYETIRVDKERITDEEELSVFVTVANTGARAGKEVVQLYIRDIESTVNRPEKELKGFEKVDLAPGERTEIRFTLNKRAFAYYNVDIRDWHVETGDFEILVGSSSRTLPLRTSVHVASTVPVKIEYTINTPLSDILKHPVAVDRLAPLVEKMTALFTSPDAAYPESVREMTESFTLKVIVMFGGLNPDETDALLRDLNT